MAIDFGGHEWKANLAPERLESIVTLKVSLKHPSWGCFAGIVTFLANVIVTTFHSSNVLVWRHR